jgi:hypothetical protein
VGIVGFWDWSHYENLLMVFRTKSNFLRWKLFISYFCRKNLYFRGPFLRLIPGFTGVGSKKSIQFEWIADNLLAAWKDRTFKDVGNMGLIKIMIISLKDAKKIKFPIYTYKAKLLVTSFLEQKSFVARRAFLVHFTCRVHDLRRFVGLEDDKSM